MNEVIIIAVLALCLLGFVGLSGYLLFVVLRMRRRFSPIIDADAELSKIKAQAASEAKDLETFRSKKAKEQVAIEAHYAASYQLYNQLRMEVSKLEERLELASYGLYSPHFKFDSSERYKKEMEKIREQQKDMVKSGLAASCAISWTVGGSEKEGAKMAKQNIKLLLRAFNGECDAAVANVTWSNISQMEQRINKSYEAINNMGSVLQVNINRDYLNLKLKELWLTHEFEEKKKAEREEQRAIREQMKEEERVQRELERAREEAEKEEKRYELALERAREEASRATGMKLDILNEEIARLQDQLATAHAQKERAVSLAQQTKSGHVYIISNVGSFGEGVYKIGMTRRLDPMERVIELGDASVPFPFDVHAMLYTEDAPELESSLHKFFEARRLNKVNLRKEFFKVSLDEIEAFAKKRGLHMELTKVAEAQEYRQSFSMEVGKTSELSSTLQSPQPPATLT